MLFRRERSTSLIAETHEFIANDRVAYRVVPIYEYIYIYMYIKHIYIYRRQLSSRASHLFARASTLPLFASSENSASGTIGDAIALESRISITDVHRASDMKSVKKNENQASFIEFNHFNLR